MLKEKIDQFYRKEEESKERDYFYVSEVDDCKRKVYFKVKGAPKEELDGQTKRKFERGNQIHQKLVSALYSLGMVTASEVKIPQESLFHGRADAIVSVDGKNYVVEIKSVSPYSFKTLDGSPKDSWKKQLQLYLHYFDIDQGIILVECKGTQKLEEFFVEKDGELVGQIISEFENLKDEVEREEIPSRPGKENWEYDKCKYCRYQEVCEEKSSEESKNNLNGYVS